MPLTPITDYTAAKNEARKTTLFAYPAGKKDAAFTVPNSVRNIEPFAFYGNGYLMALTIGKNVTAPMAIDACPALVIYGEAGSEVETGAKARNIPFVAGKAPPSDSLVLKAVPTSSTVLVNGKPISFDAYTINQSSYFKLRDLACVLSGTSDQFDVAWDAENNAIRLTSNMAYSVTGGEMAGKGAGIKIRQRSFLMVLKAFPLACPATSLMGTATSSSTTLPVYSTLT